MINNKPKKTNSWRSVRYGLMLVKYSKEEKVWNVFYLGEVINTFEKKIRAMAFAQNENYLRNGDLILSQDALKEKRKIERKRKQPGHIGFIKPN